MSRVMSWPTFSNIHLEYTETSRFLLSASTTSGHHICSSMVIRGANLDPDSTIAAEATEVASGTAFVCRVSIVPVGGSEGGFIAAQAL